VLDHILVLAVAQESSVREEGKPKVVNAVTLEVTPDQAEKLDLARSVGQLSLVLRNQLDTSPVTTEGSTKQSMLNRIEIPVAVNPLAQAQLEKVALKPKAVSKPKPKKVTPAPKEQVELIKGTDKTLQDF
jgi:pilus assembly protein CpaB